MNEWRQVEESRNIRIGFSKPKGKWFPLMSWVIRLIEQTPYSHVYVEWEARKYKTHIVYQASGTKVNFMNQKIFREQNTVTHEFDFEISEEDIGKLDLLNKNERTIVPKDPRFSDASVYG